MLETIHISGEQIGLQFRKTCMGRTTVKRKIRYHEHNGKQYPYIIWDRTKLLVARASQVYKEAFDRYNLHGTDWWVAVCQVCEKRGENGEWIEDWEETIKEYERRLSE